MSDAKKSRTSVWDHVAGVAAKFLCSALLGLVVSCIILDLGLDLPILTGDRVGGAVWIALICVAPLVWGILGVLYFDKLLSLTRKLWKIFFGFGG